MLTDPQLLAALVGHELREPINAIQSFLSVVIRERTGALNPLQAEFLQSAQTAAGRLAHRIDDVQVALSGGDALHLELGFVDLQARITACCHELSWAAERYAVSVCPRTAAPDGPTSCWGDPVRIDQILLNLIENAIRYAPAKSAVRITTDRQENDAWEVRVTNRADAAMGDDPTNWFAPYQRAGQAGDPLRPGLGLGLTVARHLVVAHGGSIWATVEDGLVTVGFTLPCAPGGARQSTASATRAHEIPTLTIPEATP